MVQTINFILLPWLPLILSMPRGAAQSAVQPVPTFASHQKWDPSIAAMVGALFCAFLFMGFFSIFLRHCSAQRATANGGGDWPCACSEGIDQKVLDTFPVLVYSTIRDLKIGKADLECAVCLNEFKDLDSLRLLPKCSHVFHPSCIEAWLSSHVTCPVCRQKLSPDYEHVAITVSSDELEGDDREEEEKGEEVEVAVEAAVRGDRMRRSNSTGHCDCEVERCTLRLPEDVRRYILANRRRSASYDNLGMSMVGGLVQQHMSD